MAKTNNKPELKNIQVNINTVEEQKKISDVPALAKRADLKITNQTEYDKAVDVLKDVKTRYKELDTERKSITRPLDEAKSAVMNLFKAPLDLLTRAEEYIKKQIAGYETLKANEAEEERKKLEKLAEQEAEKERKKIDAKIERAKVSGKEDKVEELEAQKETIVAIDVPVVSARVDTPTGVSFRDKWSAEVTDFKLLPDEYKLPNQQALDRIAQATKGAITIPGVKFHSEKVVATRT